MELLTKAWFVLLTALFVVIPPLLIFLLELRGARRAPEPEAGTKVETLPSFDEIDTKALARALGMSPGRPHWPDNSSTLEGQESSPCPIPRWL
jgi:hypothetical protein